MAAVRRSPGSGIRSVLIGSMVYTDFRGIDNFWIKTIIENSEF
jgi:hypothetical protein